MCLDSFHLFFADLTFDHISGRCLDNRQLILFDKLYALNSRICSLVKLSRKKFYRKNVVTFFAREVLSVKHIYRWFCKHTVACSFKCCIRKIFHIIADQYTYILHRLNSKITLYLMAKFFSLYCKFWFFLHIYTFYAHNFLH